MAAVNFLIRCKYTDYCRYIKIINRKFSIKMKAIDRLYDYLAEKSLKPTTVEKEMGLSNGYLSAQRKRGADIGESMMNKIIDYFRDINPEWLLTGRGEMLKTKHTPEALIPKNEPIPSNKDNKNETIKQESPINILLSIIREKDDKLQEQAEEIGRLRERVEQLECIKETKERPVSGAQSSGLADVG